MRNILANFLIGIGIMFILASAFLLWQRHNPKRLEFEGLEEISLGQAGKSSEKALTVLSIPEIPELQITLPIVSAKYSNGKLETTSKGISYLSNSGVPGEIGNGIFYGHNWTNLLGNLTRAKTGQTVEIYYADGTKDSFVITNFERK
jgi:sortase (surface protein transpeptidase)